MHDPFFLLSSSSSSSPLPPHAPTNKLSASKSCPAGVRPQSKQTDGFGRQVEARRQADSKQAGVVKSAGLGSRRLPHQLLSNFEAAI
ncbi:hypothetical protein E2C01_071983 [Portunus trituberculatus]|uniref:Uncharacterized protein n=1 Tax=Portunus trituberculatus TaxID=210409 RepID=A0A5B7I6J7_PORTR|nr:hypothetical protein [Portunus trituberculatus]